MTAGKASRQVDIAGSSSCRWNGIEHIAISRSRAMPCGGSISGIYGVLKTLIGNNPPIASR